MIFITLPINYHSVSLLMTLLSLEETVNNEVLKVSEWLNANKLTLNAKESINQPPLASLEIKTTTNFMWLKMGKWVTKCSVNIQAP